MLAAVWVMLLRRLAASSATSLRMLSAVCTIWLRRLAASFVTSRRILSAVCTIWLRRLSTSLSTVSRMLSAVWLMMLRRLRASSCASCRSSLAVWVIRVYSPLSTLPIRISFSSFSSAAVRLPPPPLAFSSLMMLCTSASAFARVTVTLSLSRILSRQLSFVTFSRIVVPYSGSGTRHLYRLIFTLSRLSPVLSLRSIPLIVTVTWGSACRFSRSFAQAVSFASVSLLWSVSVLSTRP